MIFYLGTHILSHAEHFKHSFISVNRLWKRKGPFRVQTWIMDSGAFTEISTYGHYRYPEKKYAEEINRWADCGNLELAVAQDYMCEPFILQKTGLTIYDHQRLTIERYDTLLPLSIRTVMPVLQGYTPEDYRRHLEMYGVRLSHKHRVGVGSICKRNSRPLEIIKVLEAIKKDRPDLKLHGFGLKITSLADAYISSMLYSCDSMAWSFAARKQGKNPNGLQEAMEFYHRIEREQGIKPRQLELGGEGKNVRAI